MKRISFALILIGSFLILYSNDLLQSSWLELTDKLLSPYNLARPNYMNSETCSIPSTEKNNTSKVLEENTAKPADAVDKINEPYATKTEAADKATVAETISENEAKEDNSKLAASDAEKVRPKVASSPKITEPVQIILPNKKH
jgi:hypothetical protein